MTAASKRPRAQTLGALLSSSPLLTRRLGQITLGQWQAAVGERLASRVLPEAVEAGVLWVRVPSSGWAQELSLLSDIVLERLRRQGHSIRRMKFRVAPLRSGRTESREVSVRVRRAKLPPELTHALGQLDDESLREALREAAQLSLGRQQR